MSGTRTQQDELQALRREVEELRAERVRASHADADSADHDVQSTTDGVAHPTARANAARGTLALLDAENGQGVDGQGVGADWAEIKQAAAEIVQELEAAARERPVLGMLGAFVVGLVLGRVLSR